MAVSVWLGIGPGRWTSPVMEIPLRLLTGIGPGPEMGLGLWLGMRPGRGVGLGLCGW